ncbi:hypothetical protein PanWU01x14_084240, partial [Parasponia andersonii]
YILSSSSLFFSFSFTTTSHPPLAQKLHILISSSSFFFFFLILCSTTTSHHRQPQKSNNLMPETTLGANGSYFQFFLPPSYGKIIILARSYFWNFFGHNRAPYHFPINLQLPEGFFFFFPASFKSRSPKSQKRLFRQNGRIWIIVCKIAIFKHY